MKVESVSLSPEHTFSKVCVEEINLLTGLGVEGDCHLGHLVKHRSRVRQDPSQPNLRQVHLIHGELHDELQAAGFPVTPGDLGENVTTRGLELLGLSRGTRLRFGSEAQVEVTGLRNPCSQINDFMPGLLKQVLRKAEDGTLIRKAGVMGIVIAGGLIKPGDPITFDHVPSEWLPLERV